MPNNFKTLLEKLNILKQKYNATGLKIELETEIISTTEIELAKNLAQESGLNLILKISGGSAVSDIFLSKALKIDNLLAPMIESAYALEKFYLNTKKIYQNIPKNMLFNIETIAAMKNIEDILGSKYIGEFSTVVFGRNDFCHSIGKTSDFCDNALVLEYITELLEKIQNSNLLLTIGGNITSNSKEFLKKINNPKFTSLETRKIVFDKKILEGDFEEALKMALEFEILWLESKSFENPLDNERKAILRSRS